jgi:hypothetical protein
MEPARGLFWAEGCVIDPAKSASLFRFETGAGAPKDKP